MCVCVYARIETYLRLRHQYHRRHRRVEYDDVVDTCVHVSSLVQIGYLELVHRSGQSHWPLRFLFRLERHRIRRLLRRQPIERPSLDCCSQ